MGLRCEEWPADAATTAHSVMPVDFFAGLASLVTVTEIGVATAAEVKQVSAILEAYNVALPLTALGCDSRAALSTMAWNH